MLMQAYWFIAFSVLMHVTWNLLARFQRGEARMLWWAILAHCLILGPWGLYALASEAIWGKSLIVLLLISAFSNVVYFIGLNKAYEIAPVALVYPLVRSSPILIAIWGALFFQQAVALNVWMGILVSVMGLMLMASTAWKEHSAGAIIWALISAFATSIYSLSDKAATEFLPTFGSLVGFITMGYFFSFAYLTYRLRSETGGWYPRIRPKYAHILIAGVCIGLAYALVIHAMRQLPAAIVVAFTNAGLVIAGLASIFIFGENAAWQRRLLAIGLICSGLLILTGGLKFEM